MIYTKDEHSIDLAKIDKDAIKIINQLKDYGFKAYIVGGAVRDLLIGNTPKDFDIVTDATPSKIKKIFRNSRIIGRRFRLVHVVFGTKIFSTAELPLPDCSMTAFLISATHSNRSGGIQYSLIKMLSRLSAHL